MKDLSKLKLVMIDVDGTMTDSGIYYDDKGNEIKKFSTRDAVGIIAAHYIGVEVLVATGRECEATSRRMKELKIDYVRQHVKDKKSFISTFLHDHNISKEEFAYIGDDLNDYAAMSLAGFVACPADSSMEIWERADYVSKVNGGCGVIQDVFRYILMSLGCWDEFLASVIEGGY